MSISQTQKSRPRSRLLTGLVLLGVMIALALLSPTLLNALRTQGGGLLTGSECTVQAPDGDVGLTREQAQRATTAVALQSRGLEAPDTSGIDADVLQRLADGPPDDAGPSLACQGSGVSALPEEQMTASGLTPRAEQVRVAMTEVFGEQSLGGFAPGGVGQGHGEESTHYSGRAVDVFFRPVSEENRRAGWLLAHWLVAHATDLKIQYVIFDDQFWSTRLGRAQWHDYDSPDPNNEILRHLDHVHVDVLRGGPE